ncbi:MAG TPA: hypothetical protein VNZ27_12130 [Rhodanobacter sp.]|nr:hypothetical protein [Rhodanobacter sp.]
MAKHDPCIDVCIEKTAAFAGQYRHHAGMTGRRQVAQLEIPEVLRTEVR